MAEPFLALITPLANTTQPPSAGGPVDPGYSPPWARPQPPVIAGGPGWLPRPPGPVDPGYSPPWARPPVDPGWVGGIAPPNVIGGGPIYPSGPVDPGYSPPWARPQPPYPDNALPGNQPYPDNTLPGQQPRPDHGLPPYPAHPWVPPQSPVIDPIDPTKAYIVAYAPKSGGGYERITFTVDIPAPGEPPTEATPKG